MANYVSYVLYGFLIIYILSIFYQKRLNTKELRLKINKQLKKIGNNSNHNFAERLSAIHHSFTPLAFYIIRTLIILVCMAYLVQNYLKGNGINLLHVLGFLFIIYTTSSKEHKLSLIHFLINSRLKQVEQKKNEEILILYSLVQTEIDNNNKVNSFAVIDSSKEFFKYIKPAILEYLYHYSNQPLAREKFIKKVNSEYAEVFINLIHNIEDLEKEKIQEHLRNNAEEYQILTKFNLLQNVEKKDISYATIFIAVFGINMFLFMYSLTSIILYDF